MVAKKYDCPVVKKGRLSRRCQYHFTLLDGTARVTCSDSLSTDMYLVTPDLFHVCLYAIKDMSPCLRYTEGSEYTKASVPLQELIGKGSYGIVCSAVDTKTQEKVAIKKINNVFDHVSDATRILREIKLLRLLRHPGEDYAPPFWLPKTHAHVVESLVSDGIISTKHWTWVRMPWYLDFMTPYLL